MGQSHLVIDYGAASAQVDGVELELTPMQYRVLACLAMRAGTVVSTADIIAEVWGEWYGPVDHVAVYIHHLRRKLGDCQRLIRTRRTMGYIFQGSPRPSGFASQRFTLRFDAMSNLVSVDPPLPLLGWKLTDIIGSAFPIDGFDVHAIEAFSQSVVDAGRDIFTGPMSAAHADGHRVPLVVTLHVTLAEDVRLFCTVEITISER